MTAEAACWLDVRGDPLEFTQIPNTRAECGRMPLQFHIGRRHCTGAATGMELPQLLWSVLTDEFLVHEFLVDGRIQVWIDHYL